jgi:hypothetical protein
LPSIAASGRYILRSILNISAITALGLALLPSNAFAQQTTDLEGVKAASNAFYAALAVLDGGAAMEKVFAHTPYITFVGPRSKSIIVGWDALWSRKMSQRAIPRNKSSRRSRPVVTKRACIPDDLSCDHGPA